MGCWERMWLKENGWAHVVGKASVWNKICITGKSQPQKALDPASWKEGAVNARAQSWHELGVFKETERSARWEVGLKEQIEARGTSSSHPGASLGVERNLDLISSAREPPSAKCCELSLGLPGLACGQHLRWGPRKPSVADGEDSCFLNFCNSGPGLALQDQENSILDKRKWTERELDLSLGPFNPRTKGKEGFVLFILPRNPVPHRRIVTRHECSTGPERFTVRPRN